jgi:predicted nucleic acid-binding protein
MPVKQRSEASDVASRRTLPDLNALSIQLVDDHPGHPYVSEELAPASTGEDTLLLFGYLPLRVQWVLEDLGFAAVEARNSMTSLVSYPMEFVDVNDEIIQDANEISAEKNHDVYDCFYLALARAADADRLVTTDRDFDRLCENEPFEYVNPVPESILEDFHAVG